MYGSQQRQTGGRRTKQTSFWTGPDGKRTEEFGGGGIPCLASQPLRRGGVAVEAVSAEIVYSLFFFSPRSSSDSSDRQAYQSLSCLIGFFYSLAFESSFPTSSPLRMGSESACVCVRERFALPAQRNLDRNMQPTSHAIKPQERIACTNRRSMPAGSTICLESAPQRNALGIHGVDESGVGDKKRTTSPNKITKKIKKSKASGNSRAMPILGFSNGWITAKEAGESVERNFFFEWFARSLSPGMFHRPQDMAEGELPPGGISDSTTTGIAE